MVPEVGREGERTEEVEGELLADGGGGGGDDLLNDGACDSRDVSTGGGLLEGREESGRLAESVVRAEVALDGLNEEVHSFRRWSVGLRQEVGDGGKHFVSPDLDPIGVGVGVESGGGAFDEETPSLSLSLPSLGNRFVRSEPNFVVHTSHPLTYLIPVLI